MYRRHLIAASGAIAGLMLAIAFGGGSPEAGTTGGGGINPPDLGETSDPGVPRPVEPPGVNPLRDPADSSSGPFVTNAAAAADNARTMAAHLGARIIAQGECNRATLGDVRAIEKARAEEEGRGYPGALDEGPRDLPVYLCPVVLEPHGRSVVVLAGGPSPITVSFTFHGDSAEGLPGVVFP